MKKKILLLTSYILVAAIASCAALFLAGGPAEPSKLDQLEALILERFIGEADRTAMEDAAADAMVEALGDRWSYYIPADEYASYLEQMRNAYVGVGITIQLTEDDSGFNIMEVTKGGPAEAAGLLAGDKLIAVAGTPIPGLTSEEVRALVRGEEKSFVDLTVLRDGQELTFSTQRLTLQTPVASWQMLEGSIGYVAIENFDDRCAKETIQGIEELLAQGATALIFDVRNNPGGYAHELVAVLDYLLPEGELFRTVDYRGKENVDKSDKDFLDIPMAVLVNSESYSAAEFFGAALRDYEAAILVGEKTCGKGYFQTTIQLSDGSAVGLSVGKYFTPKGENLANVGVTPDIQVAVDEETFAEIYYGQLPPQEDPQVIAAWEYLTGKK